MKASERQHVAGFSLALALNIRQRLALLTGARLIVDVAAVCQREPGRMRVRALAKTARGKQASG